MPIVILQLLIPTLLLFSRTPVRIILLVVYAAAMVAAAFATAMVAAAFATAMVAAAFATAMVAAALAVAIVAAAAPITCPNATMTVNNQCETKPNVEE